MITPVTDPVINQQSGVLRSGKAHIKSQNAHVIYDFLRNKCYSDRIRAIIREYGTNAQDIHNRHGIAQPFRVTLPTVLDSFFKVRDFGPALSDDKIEDIFLSYGESDKRTSNLETGSLGLGCKCGLAYGDSFIINAYQGGKMSIWNAYIDPSKEGKVDQLAANVETTEPDGLEIIIPVLQADINTFRSKALQVYAYFDVVPELVNAQQHELNHLEEIRGALPAVHGNGWKYFGPRAARSSLAIMANVAYNLSSNAFTAAEMSTEKRQLLDSGMIINFKNGELDFAISREELQYTTKTKQSILARMDEISNEIVQNVEAQFSNCQTMWHAKIMWKEIFRTDGSLYYLKPLFDKRCKWNGKPLNNSVFNVDEYKLRVTAYTLYNSKMKHQPVDNIDADSKHLVILNDNDMTSGIANRLISYLWEGDYNKVYLVKFFDAAGEKEWREANNFDLTLTSISTLEKKKLSDYYGTTGTGGLVNPKHVSKEFLFEYVAEIDNGYSWSRRRNRKPKDAAKWWTIANLDLKDGEGIYVPIDHFEAYNSSGTLIHPRTLKEILESAKQVGIDVPPIYGLKSASVVKVKDNPKFVNVWTWLDNAIAEFCKVNTHLGQQIANRDYVINQLNNAHGHLMALGQLVSSWSSLPANSEMIQFFQKLQALRQYDDAKLQRVLHLLHFSKFRFTGAPTYNMLTEYHKLADRYPLLFNVAQEVGPNVKSPLWSKPLEDYTTLIDMATP